MSRKYLNLGVSPDVFSARVLLRTLAFGGSIAYLLSYLWVVSQRLTTPFEVEWMEGGMIAHALRLREGLPIYAPPSLDFVPFFYTPGYPIALNLLANLTGDLSFTLARSVSALASLGVMWGIYAHVHRETKRALYAWLGVGLFAALFRTCGAFYDLARPDSLMLLFLTGAILGGRRSYSWRGVMATSILMTLAFFTKQTSAVFFPVIAGWMFWEHRGRGLIFFALTLTLCSLGVLWFNYETHGAFWSYIFEGHQGHVFYWKNILLKYWRDLIFVAPLTLLLPLLWLSRFSPLKILPVILALHWTVAFGQRLFTLDYRPHMYYRELWYESPRVLILIPPIIIVVAMILSRQWGRSRESLNTSPYWLWIFIAGAGASGLNHSTQWAYSNCFMLLALAFALAAPLMLRDLIDHADRGSEPTQGRWGRLSLMGLWLMIVTQFGAWVYLPSAQVPHAADFRAWTRLTSQLSALSTPLFFPAHPTYNTLERAMKGRHAIHTHHMGITDVKYRGGVRDLRRRLGRGVVSTRLQRSISSSEAGPSAPPRWSAVVTHERTSLPEVQRGYYEAERWHYLDRRSLKTKTGFLTRPASLWLPRDSDAPVRMHTVQGRSLVVNFERSTQPRVQRAAQRWSDLGWEAQGEAFGQGPTCPKNWRGEGRCGAVSTSRGRGELSARFTLPPYGYLSLLVRATQVNTSGAKGHIELRLQPLNSPKDQASVVRRGVALDGIWRRVILSPRGRRHSHSKTSINAQLRVIDPRSDAQVSVDDFRVGIALDAP